MPQRDQILNSLKMDKVFDVLVVGGGATGTGVALVRTCSREKWALSFAPEGPRASSLLGPSHPGLSLGSSFSSALTYGSV